MTEQPRSAHHAIATSVLDDGFDPFTARPRDLLVRGLPPRPDPHTDPGLATLWERQARRFAGFAHLPAQAALPEGALPTRALGLHPTEHCGYTLTSVGAPFTALFATWSVPNLRYVPSPHGPDLFRTFLGLGFLDVHVEMTVDASDAVTATLTAQGVGAVGLPVAPGDVLTGSLCLDANPPGRANYVLANETRSETVSFSLDTGFPPAVTVDVGVSRGAAGNALNPLAGFGAVWFDELSAYTTAGPRPVTGGQAVTMVGWDGATLATPVRLNDYAFRVVRAG
ncbi:G1 family glutamic endopeptidase [Cellulomonas shaoxiangyii]|uniref:Uncharacterized protein n=1 Tax=Cellulomonas shaoxiangyii TaxID=2566013 RepID=A0A4P7SMR9_9CELL|nr:G1 family glutamic endopeptidase [Cellulomonas shaoxiangyii]QCB94817.1 hypothetical protein E5225_15855 [Cellulomonas shaoxiangyii]TGY86547.1 hypothetical protein E5226_01880 [Cellulomonas shaoxiangyii]